MKSVLKQTLNRTAFKVLLVEDNPAEAELLQELLLEAEGVRVPLTHVWRVKEAIEALNQENFDVILLDLSLPDSQGLDTLARIQEYACQGKRQFYPAIVVLTARDDDELALQLIHRGAQDYLIKGKVESELLIRSLRYAIERQHTQETLRQIEELYCSVVDNVKEVIFQTDAALHWTFLNPAWTEITGFSIAESLGSPFLNYVHPDDRQCNLEQFQPLIEGKKDSCRHQVRYLTQSGGFCWVEVHARLTFARDGTISGTTGMLHDITEQKLAQEALRQSESRLRGYFENSLVGIAITTPEKGLIEVNDALCNLLGCSRAELTQKNWTDWTHPDDLNAEIDQLILVFAGESDGYVLDKRFIREDGQVIYTRLSVRCIRREDGTCDHLIAVILDLSDRFHYEQQLKAAEEFLTHTINAIPDPIFVKDEQHRWLILNNAFCQLIRKSQSELIGKSDYNFLPKAEAESFRETDELVLTTGVGNQNEENLTDSEGKLHIISTKKTVFKNADGTKTLVGTIRDITNYKHLLEALQRSESRFQKLAASIPGMIFEFVQHTDGSFSFPYASSACREIYEVEPEHLIENAALALDQVHLGDRDRFYESIATSAQTLQPLAWEGRIVGRRSGKLKWIQCASRPEKLANGDILWHGVAIDISDAYGERCLRQQAEDALWESQRFIQRIIEASPNILYLYDLLEQRTVYTNRKVIEILGYTPEEFQKMSSTAFKTIIHPDDRAKIREQYKKFDTAKEGETFEIEYRMRHTNGEWRWLVSRDTLFTTTADGKARQILGTATDITNRKLAQEALCISEERFRSLVSNIPGAVYRRKCDADWTMEFFSEEIERISGYPASDFIGNRERSVTSIIHPEDTARVECEVLEAIRARKPFSLEYRMLNADGGTRWIYEQGRGIFTAHGELLCLDGVLFDITARKRAETALRLSEERLQLALEGSALGLWDWNISTGKTYFDPQWKRMLGYEVEEIENNYQSWERLIHPEDMPRVREVLNAYLEGRTPIYEGEFRMLSKSGEWRWMLGHGKVFERDESGMPMRMTGTQKDITERKTLERELALREARLNAFFASSPVGLKILDDQLRFVQINEPLAEINGLPARDHIGKTLREVLPEMAPILEPLYQKVLTTGKPILNLEVNGEVPSLPGIVRYWMTSYFPIPGEENRPSGIGAVVVEISDRKRVEAVLQQQVSREQLVGAMQERIRRSLNLKEVLTTAVEEVRQFLQTDRTVIYRFHPNWSGVIEVESVGEGWMPLLGLDIQDHCFAQSYVSQYQQGRIRAIDDIHNAGLNQCHIDLLNGLEIKANLVVPLLQGETLWGLLIAHHCSGPHLWHSGEIEFLRQLSVQLAIAIQQSTLFEQAQTEIAERQQALAALRQSEAREREKAQQLEIALRDLKNTQAQLVQTEKMASLGQLVAGVAHEINNPVSFIYGNVTPAMGYASDLLELISLYQQHYPTPSTEIQDEMDAIDLDFIKEDFPKLLRSMKEGASRISEIVLSLRSFSRFDEADRKEADLHQGLNSTLMILQNRLKEQPNRGAIQVIKEFGNLPLIECYPGELNQVFMNILSNAIDALEEKLKEDCSLVPQIRICTELLILNGQNSTNKIVICIADNGIGIPANVKHRLFDPFFTTKPVGNGTGLGLSISHTIVVNKHQGELYCHSKLGQGTEFVIELPLRQHYRSGTS